MKITIRNQGQPKVPTKELRKAANYYTNLLFTPRQAKNILLQIKVGKTHPDQGYIEWLDKPVKPKEFRITLSEKLGERGTLKALAHEMAHLRQFVRGELTDQTLRSNTRWMRKEIDWQELNYFDYPWEIDAFGREIGLYIRYMRDRKKLD